MATAQTTVDVELGFLPPSLAIDDPDHPGLRRAGPRASGPYGDGRIEPHACRVVDGSQDESAETDLLVLGFDVVDLSGLGEAQAAFARVRTEGRISDDDAATIRAALDGAVLRCAGGQDVKVLHLADEGFIMRVAGPNALDLAGPEMRGMNGHGPATSVHADQDVFGTPLVQLMDDRAPELFRHRSPDGSNDTARMMLVNFWVPLQQITQPLVLADGRSVDRRRHQLRYGLVTDAFLDRDDERRINDIWTFTHDPDQRWYLRSEMDHRSAYIFDTLSTPHGAGALPGEDAAEQLYLALEAAEDAVQRGAVHEIPEAVHLPVPDDTPPALRAAIAEMAAVLAAAGPAELAELADDGATAWLARSQAARRAVVRMSLEMRLVVSLEP